MNLKELREKNKLSQAAFAGTLGVSGKSIYLIEAGRMKLSKKLSDRIAEVYGEVIEPAEKRAKAAVSGAEKRADKAAEDAAQAVLDTEKKLDKRKRRTKARAQADKPAVEAVAEAVAAPVETAVETVAAPVEAVKARRGRKRAPAPATIVIQSPFGGEITDAEIRARIGQADAVYVRVDRNKAYWVRGEETGEIDLW